MFLPRYNLKWAFLVVAGFSFVALIASLATRTESPDPNLRPMGIYSPWGSGPTIDKMAFGVLAGLLLLMTVFVGFSVTFLTSWLMESIGSTTKPIKGPSSPFASAAPPPQVIEPNQPET